MRPIFLLIALATYTSTALSSPELPARVSLATHDLYPYGSYEEDGQFDGVAYKPAMCALTNLGIALDLKVLPWHRAQLEVKQGKSDGFFAASQNVERDQYAVHSGFLADQKWKWYWLTKNKFDPGSDEFKSTRLVSSFKGANMQRWIEANGYKTNAPPKDSEKLLKMLTLERLDAILANNHVMDNLLKTGGLNGQISSKVLKSKPLYVYFNKSFLNAYPAFLTRFNASLRNCHKQ